VGLILSSSASAQAEDWPLWPTQIEQSTQALAPGSDASEGTRAAELRRLESRPDPIAEPYILRALDDESTEMRRIAMRACVERQLESCASAAERLWMETSDPAIRLRALQLLALFPTPERLETLLEALDGDEPSMRDQASESLASAPLTDRQEERLRTVLQAKLDDQSATVRRRAAMTLGLRGPGSGTVNLVRHLDDPDPGVRVAVAEALGRLADRRALPALRRALDNTPDRALAGEIVSTLGLLPGEDVDQLLLELLDRPPFNRRQRVVQAIGTRIAASDLLVDGLISRLRDGELHDSALKALRWLGELARPRAQAALERGLEASLAAELQSFLDALDIDAARTGSGADGDAERPQSPYASPISRARIRVRASVESDELSDWVISEVSRASLPDQIPEALFALALWDRPDFAAHDLPVLQTRLRRWVGDEGQPQSSRCLAAAALTRSALAGRRAAVLADLRTAAESRSGEVRACASLGLASLGSLHDAEMGLADPDPRVRAMTSLGLRATSPKQWPSSLRQRLRSVALADHSPAARSSARFALQTPSESRRSAPSAGERPPGLWLYRVSSQPGMWVAPADRAWARFQLDGVELLAPTIGYGSERWLIASGIGDLESHAVPHGASKGIKGEDRLHF
jgi:HEAT repeat protein